MKLINRYYPVFAGILIFIVYLTTLAPSVIQIDTGELATVQIILGIAHPTGYPLFTMLGYLFALIPLSSSKIFQMNLLAAIYTAGAAVTVIYSIKMALDNLSVFQAEKFKAKNIKTTKKRKRNKDDKKTEGEKTFVIAEIDKMISVILAGFILAFSRTFWFQSTSVEVYSLHLLLISLIIFTLLKAFITNSEEKLLKKEWIVFSIFLALGFTNHMTTLLVLPSVAYLYFSKNKFSSLSFKRIALMIFVFLILLIVVYSYLPIRASQSPALNWGNPIDFERIYRHISGKQYQVWLFSSSEAAKKQLEYFISMIPNEFYISLIFAIIGAVVSFFKARKFFIFNILLFVFTVLYSINYDIVDIDSYFLLAFISVSFFSVFAIIKIIQQFNSDYKKIITAIVLFLLTAGLQYYQIKPSVDQSNNFAYSDYTKNVLKTLPENSIIFSYQWDYFISASYYFQNVEDLRKDVIVIDKELLRRSWYYNQLETNHPGLLNGVKSDVNSFLEALKPFERDENFNANLLETLFRKIMTGLVSTNITKHEFFIAPEVVENEMRKGEFSLPVGYTLVPHIFFFKVVNTNNYVDAPLPDFKIRFNREDDKYSSAMKRIIGSMLVRRALYELQFNMQEKAKIYAKKVMEDFNEISLPPQLKNLVLN